MYPIPTFLLPMPLPHSAASASTPRRQVSTPHRNPTRPATRTRPTTAALSPGDQLQGTVTRLVDFGAFVQIRNESGLVHISEIADSYVSNIHDYLSVGDKVTVRVLSVDPAKKRIALSMKQAVRADVSGYERVMQLGGDWGHPWNDDGETKFAEFGDRRAGGPQDWEADPALFEKFDEKK